MKWPSISLLATLLSALLFPSSSVSASTYLVRSDGTGDYPTIRAAVDASVNGDTIALADGTFTGPDNRDIDCTHKAITIMSSSGNPVACIIDCSSAGRAFSLACEAGSGFALQDLTISNGHEFNGGGLYCCRASIRLDNVTFENCTALHGGAAAFLDTDSPQLVDCAFSGNRALSQDGYTAQGGAVYLTGDAPEAIGCRFADNSSDGSGGAVCLSTATDARLQNCLFEENAAHWGGAVSANDSDVHVADCVFRANAAWNGGAMLIVQFAASITSCEFVRNSAEVGGGGICIGPANTEVIGCTMVENGSASGGAAIDKYMDGVATIRGSTIYGSSGNAEWPGGAVCAYTGILNLENSIVAFGTAGPAVTCFMTNVNIVCSDIYGNSGGDWTGCIAGQETLPGNINLDPRFCSPADGVLMLRADSPCAEENSPQCGQIGAWPVGCDTPIPVLSTTWGRLKARFR